MPLVEHEYPPIRKADIRSTLMECIYPDRKLQLRTFLKSVRLLRFAALIS